MKNFELASAVSIRLRKPTIVKIGIRGLIETAEADMKIFELASAVS
jgi:hypothetical protein